MRELYYISARCFLLIKSVQLTQIKPTDRLKQLQYFLQVVFFLTNNENSYLILFYLNVPVTNKIVKFFLKVS